MGADRCRPISLGRRPLLPLLLVSWRGAAPAAWRQQGTVRVESCSPLSAFGSPPSKALLSDRSRQSASLAKALPQSASRAALLSETYSLLFLSSFSPLLK